MHANVVLVVGLLTVTVAGGALARRLGVPSPLLLVVMGALASPVVHVQLNEEVVLVGILPPLLYAAALQTSLLDFRSNARPIGLLSVGLVIFTALGVGLVACWMIPGLPLAAGIAIGAVLAPPDAVAATAIGKRVGLPRRLTTILEGESLVNDATALVLLRTSVAAMAGAVSIGAIAWGFVLSAGGGVVVGLVVAFVMKKVRQWVQRPVTDSSISLLTPFITFLIAERIGASGVLAVVIVGLVMGHVAPLVQSAQSRVFERTVWTTVQAVLEDAVFLLIGLQVWQVVTDVRASNLSGERIAAACAIVFLAVMLLRPLWVFPVSRLSRLVPAVARREPTPAWQTSAVLSWAGMRGVVTLAAALSLPESTPHREVLILFAMVVTGGTLLVQGSTLPWVVRRLGQTGADPAEDALVEAELLQRAIAVGMSRLEEVSRAEGDDELIEALRQRSLARANAAWELLGDPLAETPSQRYARLLLKQLSAERGEVLRVRDAGEVPNDVVQRVLMTMDIEESLVAANLARELPERDGTLTAGQQNRCEHLAKAVRSPTPQSSKGCQQCLIDGTQWVHLRLCMECGYVGCCDSSPGQHATAHFHASQHPVMRSFEVGEGWRWCFIDDLLG